jgi:hypothetical protein
MKACGKILCKLEGPACSFCNTIMSSQPTTNQTSTEFQNAVNQKLKLLQLDSSQQSTLIHGNL